MGLGLWVKNRWRCIYAERKWWGCIAIVGLVLCYLIAYKIYGPNFPLLEIISFLINSVVALAVVIYVVFTRELARSSQETAEASRKTAEANIRLVESMQSMLLEQWNCELRENPELIRNGEEISKEIHVQDKHMPDDTYSRYMRRPRKRILIFKPLNCGPRPIIIESVKFQISDTRSQRTRELSYDPPIAILINRDREKEIFIAYNIEGEMEAKVTEITYRDGQLLQKKWIANFYKELERYEELESSTGTETEEPPF